MAESEPTGLRYHAIEAQKLFGSAGNPLQRIARRILRSPIDSTQELLRASEAYSWDLELLIEEGPYRRLPGMGAGDEIGTGTLAKVRRKCRQWYRHNPIAAQWVSLTNNFVFGQGVTDPRAGDRQVHNLITDFWTNKQNRRTLTSYQAMRQRNTDLQLNGEVFLVLFVGEHSGEVQLAHIEPDQISKIVTHPENGALPLWYQRAWDRPTSFDFKTCQTETKKTEWWYPDWQATEKDLQGYSRPPNAKDALIMHIVLESAGGTMRGLPPLWRALDWLKTHRGFLEDRATLTKARAFLSWIITQKGPTPRRMGEALQSLQTDEEGRKIPPTTGSLMRLHESVEAKPVETPRDAANAMDDARMFLHPVCAASGFPEPYYGDPSHGDRVTSTNLDLPVALRTEAFRQLWTQVFDDIFQFVIDKAIERRKIKDQTPAEQRGRAEEADGAKAEPGTTRTWRWVDIDFPPLAISQGVAQLITAITDAADRGTFEETEAAKLIMQLCGVDDAAYKIQQLAAQKAERAAVAVQIAQGQGSNIPVDQKARKDFPQGERTGVRSPDRKAGAPATRTPAPRTREASKLPDWDWAEAS